MKRYISFLLTLAALPLFGDGEIPEPQLVEHGSFPSNIMVPTNQLEINSAIINKLGSGSGGGQSVIYGDGLNNNGVCYKATLASESDTQHVAPPTEYVYLEAVTLGSTIWDKDKKPVKPATDGGYSIVQVSGVYKIQSKITGTETLDTWSFSSESITGLVLSVDFPVKTTYDYSHPYDWNIFWTALDDPDTRVSEVTTYVTNTAGPIITTTTRGVIKNNKAKLYINYFDEVNSPTFNLKEYSIISGNATISGDILTASQSGIVNVKAEMSDGQTRSVELPMYQWTSTATSSRYETDSSGTTWAANRKRVNDYHMNLLSLYRQNPTTNYVYYTWNEPTSAKHMSNPGDRFVGEYGSKFHPYQHIGCDSGGGTGFWWSHGVLSKHVLLAAAHYGDYNFNRFLNGTEYINWDNQFSGKKALKMKRWYYASQWAAEHGFEGTDAQCGDLAFWVVEGEIPDECLPYIASADWINANYGVDVLNYPGDFGLCTVWLTQSALVSIKVMRTGSCISALGNPYMGATWYDSDGNFLDNYSSKGIRLDIAREIGKGGWHDGILGDSGKPSYIYDPALTTGLTDTSGRPLLRPIILHPTTWASGGCSGSVARHCKVVKAFCEWVGDTLDYTLGDIANQSTDTEVIKQHAIEAMGGTYVPPEPAQ